MDMKFFAVFSSVLLLLAITAVEGAESVQASQYIARARPTNKPVYFVCEGYWVPDGVIAGSTAGYPYYGWYGYPYVPYRCVHMRHRRYGKIRHRSL